jgi:hypothetical protein
MLMDLVGRAMRSGGRVLKDVVAVERVAEQEPVCEGGAEYSSLEGVVGLKNWS